MRVRTGAATKRAKKKYFKIAKGYYSDKSKRWRQVQQQVEKSLKYAYTGRKDRKGDFRSLWIMRINALSREFGLSYSKFMSGLKKSNIIINRKQLAKLAVQDKDSFQKLIELSKAALA